MTSSSVARLPRKLARFALGFLFSPFDYIKELVLFAAIIALASWTIGSLQIWWSSERVKAAAAAHHQPSISRLLANTAEGEIVLYRDFREIVTLDVSGEEMDQRRVASREFLYFGLDPQGWSFLTLNDARKIVWWHSTLGELSCDPGPAPRDIHDLSLSADGQTAAALFQDGEIRLWSRSEDGSITSRSWPAPNGIDKISLSPQGRRLAIKIRGNELQWLETETGRLRTGSQCDLILLLCRAWSEDERWFAVGTENKQIQVWNAESNTATYAIQAPGVPTSLALSADGRWLIAGLSTGELAAWCEGRLAWSIPAHPSSVRALDLCRDGLAIVSGCLQGKLLMHSLESGQLLREIPQDRH